MTKLNLPDYKLQSEEVKDRFERLKQRPVTLEVKNLYKHFKKAKAFYPFQIFFGAPF